mgnify:CR=1 FL=1|tara:strand:- start:2249 stop:4195 length:1947 start_codon:yes stop_codon:yes gene_type:complete
MFNPLKWFTNDKKYTKEEMSGALDSAMWYAKTENAGNALSWSALFGNAHPNQFKGDGKAQMVLSAIYCAVNSYTGAITGLPRFCQKIDPATGRPLKFVKTTEHPAARIWNHYANDELSSDELLKLMIYDVLFRDGNFYALPEYDSLGRVYRLQYVHPDRVPRGNIYRANGDETLSTGRTAAKGSLVYKIIVDDKTDDQAGQELLLPHTDVIHIKGLIPDPENFRSQGVIENNMRAADLYDAAEEMGSKFYSRGYSNQMYLSTDHQLSPKVRKELENTINNTVTGGSAIEDIFKTKVLEHGLKPVHVGMPLNQLQFIETRAFSIEDVARWFNMPAMLLHSVMGVTILPDGMDKVMMSWIQNGLGSFMSNLSDQFRDQVLPRSSQPLYKFDFQRLHLYKTLLNEFSQALRNLFEIGAIDRTEMASLLGLYLDPSDVTNTQRYSPANLITSKHSLLLQKKAKASIDVMQQDMEIKTEDQKLKKESHDQTMEQSRVATEAQEAAGVASPGGAADPSSERQKDGGEPLRTSEKQPTKEKGDKALNLVRTALQNTLKGLHDYELRVVGQKQSSRKDDFSNAMLEWYPKFQETMTNTLGDWSEVMESFGLDIDETINIWIANSQDVLTNEDVPASLTESFNNIFSDLGDDNEPSA